MDGFLAFKSLPCRMNIWHKGYPKPSASVYTMPDSSMYQAIDGRIWYFPEITNRWTTEGSASSMDWFALDFGTAHEISSIKLYLYADNKSFVVPDTVAIEYQNGGDWIPVKIKQQPGKFIGNTVNTIAFDNVTANKIRINFKHTEMHVAVSEIECY